MTHSLLALLALIGFARAGTVDLDGATFRALTDRPPEPRVEAPAPVVADREVTLTPVEGGLLVRARWTVRVAEPGWFAGALIGPGAHVGAVTWNGRPAAIDTTDAGTVAAGFVTDRAEITLDAFVPGEAARLLPAVRGRVRYDGAALSADGALALSDGDGFLTGAAEIAPAEPPPSADAGPLILAHTGLGVTVGDAEVSVRARVGWEVRRGRLDAVAIRVAGLGDDLDVEGPNVASWQRVGDRVEIALREPALDRVDVTLVATTPTPSGTEATLSLPRIEPLDAFRAESTVQVAREEGLEVVPALAGWQAVPSSALPSWGRDLVVAAPSGAWRAAGTPAGSLSLLRFEPLPLPPLVIDVADHRVATTSEGRVLARALYEIRNERAPWLRIVPPEGWDIVGVRVSGDTARPVTDGGPGWLVPLPRSVDTVQGLLSFPVEVAFLGEGSPWADATETSLALPSVDAEVADWRATLFLPPGWRSRAKPGEGHVVDAFASGEGIVYGVSIGGAKVAEADALFEEAVAAWLDNDFEGAQERLDTLRALGGEGENVDKLQSNIDLIVGANEVEEDYSTRQIRSQARARASSDEIEMRELEKKAEERQRAGDYAAASSYYEQALEIGETIVQLEGEESVEIASSNATYRENLDVISKDQEQRAEVLGEAATTLPWDVEGDLDWDTSGEVAWDVEGEPEWLPAEEPVEGVGYGMGVGGGAIGGVGYGAEGSEVVVVSESLQRLPAAADRGRRSPRRDRDDGEVVVERRRGGLGGVFAKRKAPAPPPAAGYAQADDLPFAGLPAADLTTPTVHASALSVVVPEVGESVRFQRRLVPAGDTPALEVDAKITVRERRNS